MAQNPFRGALFLLGGFQLLARPGLRRYVAVPLAVNLLVFGVGIWAGAAGFDQLMERMRANIPGWLSWLEWLLWPLFVLALLIIVFYSFTLLANLLAAPFNGLLAEQAERVITGRRVDDNTDWPKLLRELPATLADEVRKVLYALLWSVPFLLLALLVPLIGPLLWFLFSAWVLALQYLDFPMGNHGLKFRQMRTALWRRLPLGLSFGGAVSLATAIPVVNFAVMPAAVAGATLMWCTTLRGQDDAGLT
jgi:CysZ protein